MNKYQCIGWVCYGFTLSSILRFLFTNWIYEYAFFIVICIISVYIYIKDLKGSKIRDFEKRE